MKIRSILFSAVLLGTAGVTALVACSSDESSSSSSGGTTDGTITVRVSAATGGTVSDPSGKATLAIPPGALDKDTDITLKVSPAANGAAGDVLDFGPDGLKFLKPATLTMKTDGVTVPNGKTAVIAVYEGGAWKAIDGSKLAGNVVTGDVAHFTQYTFIFVDGQVTVVPPANCAEAAAFTPCGGDPTGKWKFGNLCLDPKTTVPDPFKGTCPQYQASVDFTSDGTITFTGTATSGTFTTTDSTATLSYAYTFPLTCAQAMYDSGAITCQQLSGQKAGDPQCVDAGGGNCKCSASGTNQSAGNTKNYTTSGNIFTETDSQGNTKSGEYCVKGNVLYYKEDKDGGTGLIYSLIKQ